MNFIFSCSSRYLTRSLLSLVRYWVKHSKIKFIYIHAWACNILYISLQLAPENEYMDHRLWNINRIENYRSVVQ